METISFYKISDIEVKAISDAVFTAVVFEIDTSLQGPFKHELEVTTKLPDKNLRTIYSTVTGGIEITKARFQGTHASPPDPDRVDVHITEISTPAIVDEFDTEYHLEIDTKVLARELSAYLSIQ
ncbi:MAG: hypothetical protein WC833_08835 [Bacteroidales bacterium]|jgi:hypothetical protein